jgi:hypothetical protein
LRATILVMVHMHGQLVSLVFLLMGLFAFWAADRESKEARKLRKQAQADLAEADRIYRAIETKNAPVTIACNGTCVH